MYILLGLSVFHSVSSPFVLVYSFVELPTAKRSFIKLLLLSPFVCVGALCHWRPPTLSSFLSTLSDFLPRSPKPKEPPALANQLLTKHQPRPTFSNFFFFSLVQNKKSRPLSFPCWAKNKRVQEIGSVSSRRLVVGRLIEL